MQILRMRFSRLHTIWLPLAAALLLALGSCETPQRFEEKGELAFSTDTLAFDSIFTTFAAPSGRLIVYNNTDHNILISRVWMDDQLETVFSLIADGRRGDDQAEFPLAKGDSLLVLVTFKSGLRDAYTEGFVNFRVGEKAQRVLVRARIIDAFLFRTVRDSAGGYRIPVITRDTTFTPQKKIVIDGPLIVANGATLTIAAGTQIFFTPFKVKDEFSGSYQLFSLIYVETGSLRVLGTRQQPVLLQGSRFDSLYMENPAQWRGLWLSKDSRNSLVEHAVIKNGLIGIRVDSSAWDGQPKLTMRYTEVRNMGYAGVLGLGYDPNGLGNAPQLLMENCLVNNCKDYTMALSGGGNYAFYNCTFGNYTFAFNRRNPQLLVNNYLSDGVSILAQYDLRAHFFNSIVWGSREEELSLDDKGRSFDLRFDHCMVKTSTDTRRTYDYSPYFFTTQQNIDPLFNDPRSYDYRLKAGSLAIDAGLDFSTRYTVDFRNDPAFVRSDGKFDIGCYEYYPIR